MFVRTNVQVCCRVSEPFNWGGEVVVVGKLCCEVALWPQAYRCPSSWQGFKCPTVVWQLQRLHCIAHTHTSTKKKSLLAVLCDVFQVLKYPESKVPRLLLFLCFLYFSTTWQMSLFDIFRARKAQSADRTGRQSNLLSHFISRASESDPCFRSQCVTFSAVV